MYTQLVCMMYSCVTIVCTWVLLVGDRLSLCRDGVLEDVYSVLYRLPVQANLQRVNAGGDILGQQVAWLFPETLWKGRNFLQTQAWCRWNNRRKRRKKSIGESIVGRDGMEKWGFRGREREREREREEGRGGEGGQLQCDHKQNYIWEMIKLEKNR